MNIVCTGSGKFIEIQGTAEREPFNREQMNQMFHVGCRRAGLPKREVKLSTKSFRVPAGPQLDLFAD